MTAHGRTLAPLVAAALLPLALAASAHGQAPLVEHDGQFCHLVDDGRIRCERVGRRADRVQSSDSGFTGLTVSGSSLCALRAGRVHCGPRLERLSPHRRLEGVVRLRSGVAFLAGGRAHVVRGDQSRPLVFMGPVTDVSGEINARCGVRPDGSVVCEGSNRHGQLGRAHLDDEGLRHCGNGEGGVVSDCLEEPAPVPGVRDATRVVRGNAHACALHQDGHVSCWGRDGLGDAEAGHPPRRVPGLSHVVDLIVLNGATCALRRDGRTSCWGDNRHGLLFPHDARHVDRPSTQPHLRNAAALHLSRDRICVVTRGDLLQCNAARPPERRSMGSIMFSTDSNSSRWGLGGGDEERPRRRVGVSVGSVRTVDRRQNND